jgi:hypothetical protein
MRELEFVVTSAAVVIVAASVAVISLFTILYSDATNIAKSNGRLVRTVRGGRVTC